MNNFTQLYYIMVDCRCYISKAYNTLSELRTEGKVSIKEVSAKNNTRLNSILKGIEDEYKKFIICVEDSSAYRITIYSKKKDVIFATQEYVNWSGNKWNPTNIRIVKIIKK